MLMNLLKLILAVVYIIVAIVLLTKSGGLFWTGFAMVIVGIVAALIYAMAGLTH